MIERRRRRRRRGLIAVAMLIGLMVLGLVAASLLRVATARRGQARADEARAQAELLLAAGIGRASARLDANPQYPGEAWEVSPAELANRGAATVTIRIDAEAQAAPGAGRGLVVVAEYRVSAQQAVRLGRTIPLPPPTPAR